MCPSYCSTDKCGRFEIFYCSNILSNPKGLCQRLLILHIWRKISKNWNFGWQLHPREFARVRWNYIFFKQNRLNIFFKLVLSISHHTQVTILGKNCWKMAKIRVFRQLCLTNVPKLFFCADRWIQLIIAVILRYLL